MTKTITEAFELPQADQIGAMQFVIKLNDAQQGSAGVAQLVEDYVITPAVERELPRILDDMRRVWERGEEYGRFIHGSFGSGKSHFMTMLSLLIEGAPSAMQKFAPLLEAHRAAKKGADGGPHADWLARANLLVVRLHMLSVKGRASVLTTVTICSRCVACDSDWYLGRKGGLPLRFCSKARRL